MILVERFVGQDQNFFVSFEFDAQGYWPTLSSVEFKSQPRNVRSGSLADIEAPPTDVRFTHISEPRQVVVFPARSMKPLRTRNPRRVPFSVDEDVMLATNNLLQ